MKSIMMSFIVAVMNIIYIFFKMLPTRKKVVFISRQSNRTSLDFTMLIERLREDDSLSVVVLTRTLDKSLLGITRYFFHMFRQMYHLATSRAVIVDSYCILVSILHHKKQLKVMQIWHALSAVKKFGYDTIDRPDGSSRETAEKMKMHRNYDFVACASKTTADFFCSGFDVKKEKIVFLGLPRIDYILKDKSDVAELIRQKYPPIAKKRNIIYIPTFRKGRGIAIKPLIDGIDLKKYNLIIKLHPLDKETDHYKEDEGVIYEERFNSYDLIEIADAIISDYSAFVVEASLAEKPMYLYIYDFDEYVNKNGVNVNFIDEAIGKYAFKDAKALIDAMEQEYDYDALSSFCNKYIDVKREDCTGQLADFIKDKML